MGGGEEGGSATEKALSLNSTNIFAALSSLKKKKSSSSSSKNKDQGRGSATADKGSPEKKEVF